MWDVWEESVCLGGVFVCGRSLCIRKEPICGMYGRSLSVGGAYMWEESVRGSSYVGEVCVWERSVWEEPTCGMYGSSPYVGGVCVGRSYVGGVCVWEVSEWEEPIGVFDLKWRCTE